MSLLLQAVFGFVAAAGGAALLWLPGLRDATGFPLGLSCFVWAGALGAALVAASLRTPLRVTGVWAATLLLGQAASLQLIDAGPAVHYQHYRLAGGALLATDGLALLVLAAQALAVAASLWRMRRPLYAWLVAHLGRFGLLLVAALWIGAAAFPSREPGVYLRELLLSSALRAVQLGSLIALLASVPASARAVLRDRVRRLLEAEESGRAVVVGCAIFAACVAATLSLASYERHPHVPDEVAYLLHARYFADAELGTPVPAVPEAFDAYLWACDEQRCFSPVPPGWPAALALGVRASLPWLVNPLLAALAVVLAHRLMLLLYDRRTARLTILLLAASPWLLLVSMSFMTHVFSLCCALFAANGVASMHRAPQGRIVAPALLGGFAIGLVSLTRPLEGTIVAGVLGLAALTIRARPLRMLPVTLLALGSIVVGALVLPYNQAMTGDPLEFPIMAYADVELGPGVNALGFGPDRGTPWGGLDPFPGHGLPDVIVNSVLNWTAIDVELFGWAVGSTLPLALLLAMRSWRRKDLWLAGFVAAVIGCHAFYWYSGGPDFGARYWFLAIVPLAGLSARAVLELADRLARGADEGLGSLAVGGALLLCVVSLVEFVPWRAIDKYHHYRGMRADVRQIVADRDFRDALLLVRGERHPDYASAIVYSGLDPAGPEPLIAWDRSPIVRERLIDAYPNRSVWFLDGPSITGAGYRLSRRGNDAPTPRGNGAPTPRGNEAP